ncbi:MAG: TolC family protein [Planctomycetes bacterium]|nr:TolC family protein [Planctomycetota bacterium]
MFATHRRFRLAFETYGLAILLGLGASASSEQPVVWKATPRPMQPQSAHVPAVPTFAPIVRTAAEVSAPASSNHATQPPVRDEGKLPIDLATALRLANAQNPTIALARSRVAEAMARQDQAEVLWLPNLSAGSTYIRHDGNTQNQLGLVFVTSRSSVFAGGGSQLRVDTADAYFLPLVARRLTQAEVQFAQATTNNLQLDVASAYLDLLQVNAARAINADTLLKAEQMLDRAKAADKSGLSKTGGDINRARTEVALRRQERIELEGRSSAASARLAKLLLLQPDVELVPADPVVVPIRLVEPDLTLDRLIDLAILNRPELAANRSAVLAARERVRQARFGPLLPRVQVDYLNGTFGGGQNSYVGKFENRGDGAAMAYWELRNLGFGNAAQVRERRTQMDQAALRVAAVQAEVGAEVTESAKLAAARFRTLDDAQDAVREASELYRKLLATQFGMVGPNPRYDALEPLLAIQSLNQARVQYLTQVIEFNRAQFRLFTAIGQPAECALPNAQVQEIRTPVLPSESEVKGKEIEKK